MSTLGYIALEITLHPNPVVPGIAVGDLYNGRVSAIDLNCDLGESFGRWTLGEDAAMLDVVSSANIACGFHAGDPSVMRRTVAAAHARGVTIGAHPGYLDLRGFGRTAMGVPVGDLENDVLYQVGALAAMCRAEGATLRYVKPHGALYNTVAADPRVARAVVRAVRSFDPSLALLALAGSAGAAEARAAGVRVVAEAFIDRAYRADGTLAPRSESGSLMEDPQRAAQRAVRMASEGTVEAVDGTVLRVDAETLCVHGDTPAAVEIATRVAEALDRAGIRVAPFALSSP